MKISELIAELEKLKEEYGDRLATVNCNGLIKLIDRVYYDNGGEYIPSSISILCRKTTD